MHFVLLTLLCLFACRGDKDKDDTGDTEDTGGDTDDSGDTSEPCPC